MTLLLRTDLDALGCTEPDCGCGVGDFYVDVPDCHPAASLAVHGRREAVR